MTPPLFRIDLLRTFSADGNIYRAFGHLVSSRMGTLLLVPFHLVIGRCDDVVDGCPVPWEEVFAVLEYPVNLLTDLLEIEIAYSVLTDPKFFPVLSELFPVVYAHEWEMDHITPMVNGTEKVFRFVHSCGVRYAVVMP